VLRYPSPPLLVAVRMIDCCSQSGWITHSATAEPGEYLRCGRPRIWPRSATSFATSCRRSGKATGLRRVPRVSRCAEDRTCADGYPTIDPKPVTDAQLGAVSSLIAIGDNPGVWPTVLKAGRTLSARSASPGSLRAPQRQPGGVSNWISGPVRGSAATSPSSWERSLTGAGWLAGNDIRRRTGCRIRAARLSFVGHEARLPTGENRTCLRQGASVDCRGRGPQHDADRKAS
jgi:hypothetical protein